MDGPDEKVDVVVVGATGAALMMGYLTTALGLSPGAMPPYTKDLGA